MLVKILLVILFFAIMISVGIYSKRMSNSVDGFVLGGRSVGPWLTAFAFGTSYFSAVVFVGYAGQFGWKFGLSSTWIGIGNAIIGSTLAWMILGSRTRQMTRWLNSRTMPDFFESRYLSKGLKIAASIIIFIFLIPYTASIYNGIGHLFEMGFGISFRYCIILMALFTAFYVVLGGYMATALNDFIQGMIMLGGIVLIIVFVLNQKGGLTQANLQLMLLCDDNGNVGTFATIFGPDPFGLLGVVILTSLGTWGLPQMIGKFYSIKDQRAIERGTIISTVFAVVISCGCYFLGGFGRLFDNPSFHIADKVMYDAIVPYMLSGLPDILIGLVILLVLSASMSTLASLVLTSSSTMTLDLIKDNIVKDMSEHKQLLIMRGLIVVFIIISVIIALYPPTFIAQLMGISWGALAGSFLAPFLYGLYFKNISVTAVWASFVIGAGFTVLNLFTHFIASPINAGAIAMLAGLVIVPIISLFTPKPDKKEIERIFQCYKS
ncbi:MAG: sodium:solute symporter [Bacteroidaceae bacterium]|nr:sodium:solute symporter [Bacteroidaceae bacterium]